MMTLREELIQVAAVAVAIVQDLDYGTTEDTDFQLEWTLDEVALERSRQEAKWGSQHHDMGTWLAILAEEVGEVAAEVDLSLIADSWRAHLIRENLLAAERCARLHLATL